MFVSKMRITFLSSVKMATKTLVSSQAFSRNSSSNALDLVKSITLLNKRDLETEITEVTRRTCAKIWTPRAFDRTPLNQMFTCLGIYLERFKKRFLKQTSEGLKYMHQSDVPDYLKHDEIRLHEENESCFLYQDANFRKPLLATVERQLLECHISAILDKVSWKGDAGKISVIGTDYKLQQCHWHSPSEHTFNGTRYNLEQHIVNLSSHREIAVVGIILKNGRPDPFLAKNGISLISAPRYVGNGMFQRHFSNGPSPPPRPPFQCPVCWLKEYEAKDIKKEDYKSKENVTRHYQEAKSKGGSNPLHHYNTENQYCKYCGCGHRNSGERRDHEKFCPHRVWEDWNKWRIERGL